MVFDIQIRFHTIFFELIFELLLLRKSNQRKCLFISPFVFLEFLFFLCHHKLKSQLADQYLQKLQFLVLKDNGRYITRHTRDIAWDIVGISQNLSGNLEQARFAYYRSLQQFPANGIDEAVKKRLASIEREF